MSLSSTSSTGMSVDDPCPSSVPVGTMSSEGTDNKSAPDRSCNSTWSGASPTSTEGTDRLMPSVDARAHTPRPSTCPVCGLSADNAVVVRAELTATATYCDTAGHLWSVTWIEVA